jgi:hypothetical protein
VSVDGSDGFLPPKADGTYEFEPFGADEMKFNQVNTFWHALRLLENNLQPRGWIDQGVPIRLKLVDGQSPSDPLIAGSYDVGQGIVRLFRPAIGTPNRHAAKDGDIIRHETTHAALIPMFPGEAPEVNSTFNYYEVHEGLADYFAAIGGGNGRIGEYIAGSARGVRDISSSPAAEYNMSRIEIYRGNPYEAGRILSGALFDLRATLGGALVDELLFSAGINRAFASFRSIADGMRSMDIQNYGGAHLNALNAAFAARGIHPGSTPELLIGTTHGGLAVQDQPTSVWVDVIGGYGPFQYAWERSDDNGASWMPVSSAAFPQMSFATNAMIRCSLTDQVGGVWVTPTSLIRVFDRVPVPISNVTINGPDAGAAGTTMRFTFTANSIAVQPATWWVYRVGTRGVNLAGPTVDVTPFVPFRITVSVSGVAGGAAFASKDVNITGPVAFVESVASGPTLISQESMTRTPVAIGPTLPRLITRGTGALLASLPAGETSRSWTAEVFDLGGRMLSKLENIPPGAGRVVWNPASAAPGVYVVRLSGPMGTSSHRTILLP